MELLFSLFLFCLFPNLHGDLQFRIEEVSQSITHYPDSLSLYANRGDLYLQHEDFNLAQRDFSYCLAHGFENAEVLQGLSRSMIFTSSLDSALFLINLSLEKDSSSFSAKEWKAHLLFLLHSYCESAILYEQLIELTPTPSPGLYIDVSNAWLSCSGPGNKDKAIEMLKSGMTRIGSLHVLQKELIRVYIEQRDYKNALIEQSYWIDRASLKASPLLDRAKIFILAGENTSAQTDLENALTELSKLPPYKQRVPGMMKLKERIESLLTQLKG